MANKFILVPEDIYRGLTTSDLGDPNLDFTRRNLEKSKRRKESESSKNVHYNQELRRYLQLRNERENRPVKVEVVNKTNGVILPKNNSRPAAYVSASAGDDDRDDDDNDNFWMGDNYSFSSYPKEPPNHAYNIVPPLSSSSEGLDTKPSTSTQALKRNAEDNYGEVSKSIKISRETNKKKNRRKIKKNSSTVGQNSNITVPQRHLPPVPLTDLHREDTTNSDPFKRRRIADIKKERQKEIELIDIKRKELKRKSILRKSKTPIDQWALQNLRQQELNDINPSTTNTTSRRRSQKVLRGGESPPPATWREKVKRKLEIPEGSNLISNKRLRRPVTKKQSEEASRIWTKRLSAAGRKIMKNKWAKQKPTQEDINNLNPYRMSNIKGRTIQKKEWATKKPTQSDINNFKPRLW
ncbi:unnamed protein product [Meloidogyne enterolobii]|uniref:Uncharacterized protein n=1 Tax=Meloidogyne enterolobii TaxID=390850 RepID=A0ACB0YG29_MELEN